MQKMFKKFKFVFRINLGLKINLESQNSIIEKLVKEQ